MIDDPLPTHGTFGDPGTNPGSDNFFFFFFGGGGGPFFPHASFTLHYLPDFGFFSTWYITRRNRTYQVEKQFM